MSQAAGEYDVLVARHRGELYAHCYRMLGSAHDAEDVLQEALTAAEREYDGSQDRAAARVRLFRIVTSACLEQVERRPRRILTPDYGSAYTQTAQLGEPVLDQAWIEPLPGDGELADDPQVAQVRREAIELAYVAALQHLPGQERAALLLHDVLAFSATDTAAVLGTTTGSVSDVLASARNTITVRGPEFSQQQELGDLGEDGVRILVGKFMAAWQAADTVALSDLLTDDARYTMPPLPCWFDGRDAVLMFLTERAFLTSWRLRPITANAQPGFACYQAGPDGVFRLSGVHLLGLRDGRVAHLAGFLDPTAYAGFVLPGSL